MFKALASVIDCDIHRKAVCHFVLDAFLNLIYEVFYMIVLNLLSVFHEE